MQFIAALIAICKAIPALTRFAEWLSNTLDALEKKRNEATAAKRLADKNAAVDQRIAEFDRLHPYPNEQRPEAYGSAGLSVSSNSSSGMGPGRAQDNQSTRI